MGLKSKFIAIVFLSFIIHLAVSVFFSCKVDYKPKIPAVFVWPNILAPQDLRNSARNLKTTIPSWIKFNYGKFSLPLAKEPPSFFKFTVYADSFSQDYSFSKDPTLYILLFPRPQVLPFQEKFSYGYSKKAGYKVYSFKGRALVVVPLLLPGEEGVNFEYANYFKMSFFALGDKTEKRPFVVKTKL